MKKEKNVMFSGLIVNMFSFHVLSCKDVFHAAIFKFKPHSTYEKLIT